MPRLIPFTKILATGLIIIGQNVVTLYFEMYNVFLKKVTEVQRSIISRIQNLLFYIVH